MRVLITGGAGFIGSTIASACEDAGHQVVVLDDFSTGRREFVLGRTLYEGSITDAALLDRVFSEQAIDAVVHCAAKIVVPESVADPLGYYENNVGGSIDLLRAMQGHRVGRLLFSSSASIYGAGGDQQVTEDSPLLPGSPYATSKYMVEQILRDSAGVSGINTISLRYFNPIGADPQLRTGQQIERPANVMGMMMQAWREGSTFTVTGVDWPTRDGSGIRDYIHVWDLARAHVAALERFDQATAQTPYLVINIGTGSGVTVKELAAAFQDGTGQPLQIDEGPPRPGDIAGAYTVSDRAAQVLDWQAELNIADGVRDSIAWVERRPQVLGY